MARRLKPPSVMASGLVLVLEDDRNLQESVRRLVESYGLDAMTARSLPEALRVLERLVRPCLVLLDTLMQDGAEAMAQLGARYALAIIPVRVSASRVRRMSKRSVDLDLLREALRRHCRRRDADATPV